MLDIRLYMLQRLSALFMAPFVVVHLAVMTYAIQGGLSTAEILGRTQGSTFWILFYGGFVVAVSIHAAIGLRVLAHEITGVTGMWLAAFTWVLCLAFLFMGMRAVIAVTVL
ncbi:MAG: succinate dehydrogenase [Paracoccaceae bacterium]